MFNQLLKNLRQPSPASAPGPRAGDSLGALQERAPLRQHFEILYAGARFGQLDYADLFWRCANDTDTAIYPANLFRRAQGGINLARYFLATFAIPGRRAECGVYRGLSSLLVCRAARAVHPDFDGGGMHLFDSFERFSAPTEFDMIPVRNEGGVMRMQPPFPPNYRLNTSFDEVTQALAEFPGLAIQRGWLPQVLQQLPEAAWSFVHLDVDLYEPTLGGLAYFFPRLSPGGVIITDDYGAERYPGARKAWEQFCGERKIPYIVLATGQAVIMRV